jgi:hypothetical protein
MISICARSRCLSPYASTVRTSKMPSNTVGLKLLLALTVE